MLTPSQLEWLRANNRSFAHVEATMGDVIREARRKVEQQLAELGRSALERAS